MLVDPPLGLDLHYKKPGNTTEKFLSTHQCTWREFVPRGHMDGNMIDYQVVTFCVILCWGLRIW